MLGKGFYHKFRVILIYLFIYFIYLFLAYIQLRSVLVYFNFGSLPPSNAFFNIHPIFGFIEPSILERWFLDIYDIVYLFMYPFGPSIVTINVIVYMLTISIAGFSFFLYSSEIFKSLGFENRKYIFASIFSGFFYMSNPLFFVGDLFWFGEILSYSIIPLILLVLHISITSDSKFKSINYILIFSLLYSIVLVEDSSHILTYGTIAFLVQILISRTIKKISLYKSFALLLGGFALGALMDLPTFLYLFFQHYLGIYIYTYSGPVSPYLHSPWLNVNSFKWLFSDNLWFNNTLIFENLKSPDLFVYLQIMLGFLLFTLSSITVLYSFFKDKNKKFPLLMYTLSIITIFLYYNYNGISLINILPKETPFYSILIENYIPEFIITIVYSLLPEYLLLLLLSKESNKKYIFKFNFIKIKKLFKFKEFINYRKLKIFILKISKILVTVSIIIILIVSPLFMAFPSYFYSASLYSGIGNAITVNRTTLMDLNGVVQYLQNHTDGNVFWLPQPPLIGSSGPLIGRSYYYPFFSDGPFSTELFSFLVGGYRNSLLNTGNFYALGKLSAYIGIRYFIFYGNYITKAISLEQSGIFNEVYKSQYAVILENKFYKGLVNASPNALLVSGGLINLVNFLPYENKIYNNSSSPIPFMTDTYPFFNLSNENYSILTNNLTQLSYELNIINSGYEYLYFPYNIIQYNSNWSFGNLANAGGYSGFTYLENLPDFSWQSTYTVNNGVVFTLNKGSNLSFKIPITEKNFNLMLRIFVTPLFQTNFTVYINNLEYNISIPSSNSSHFEWVNLGTLNNTYKNLYIKIINHQFTSINAIDVCPLNIWNNALNETTKILTTKTVYLINNNLENQLNLTMFKNLTLLSLNNYAPIFLLKNYTIFKIVNNKIYSVSIPKEVNVPLFSNQTRVLVKLNESLKNALKNNFTINAIIKLLKPLNNTTQAIVSSFQNGNISFMLSILNNMPRVTIKTSNGKWLDLTATNIKLFPNIWYDLTFSINDTIENLYLNGSLIASKYINGFSLNTERDIYIGMTNWTPTLPLHFNGLIASVSIINKFYNSKFIYNDLINTSLNFIKFYYFLNISSNNSFIENLTYVKVNNFPWYYYTLNYNFKYNKTIESININKNNFSIFNPNKIPQIIIINKNNIININIQVFYKTENTYFGNIVKSIKIVYPEKYLGNIYIIVSGFGAFGIVDTSYLLFKDTEINPIPAVEGGEGFIIKNSLSDSNNTLIIQIYWYDQFQNLIENLISYVTLIITICMIILYYTYPCIKIKKVFIKFFKFKKS